jgi:hypothetical protein
VPSVGSSWVDRWTVHVVDWIIASIWALNRGRMVAVFDLRKHHDAACGRVIMAPPLLLISLSGNT